jgi:hypothetical protein
MNTKEILTLLNDAGFTEGFAIRDGFIVVWENEASVPDSLTKFVKLDVN